MLILMSKLFYKKLNFSRLKLGGGRCVSITYAKMAIFMQERAIYHNELNISLFAISISELSIESR